MQQASLERRLQLAELEASLERRLQLAYEKCQDLQAANVTSKL